MKYEYDDEMRLETLRQRSARCVCKYCGSRLKLRRIIFSEYDDARIEIFCRSCERIEYGVEPEVYTASRYLVDEIGFDHYPDMDKTEATRKMNIAKVCEVSTWMLRNLGLADESGFNVPVDGESPLMGECVLLKDDDLNDPAVQNW